MAGSDEVSFIWMTPHSGHLLWSSAFQPVCCVVAVVSKECVCLMNTYGHLRKLWENKEKEGGKITVDEVAGFGKQQSGVGVRHVGVWGSDCSLGSLPPSSTTVDRFHSCLVFQPLAF